VECLNRTCGFWYRLRRVSQLRERINSDPSIRLVRRLRWIIPLIMRERMRGSHGGLDVKISRMVVTVLLLTWYQLRIGENLARYTIISAALRCAVPRDEGSGGQMPVRPTLGECRN
jgi:hypothetical protein